MNTFSSKIVRLRNAIPSVIFATAIAFGLAWGPAAARVEHGMSFASGKDVYRFYCYQCHGYSGNARTLSSTYLDPKPRDFSAATRESLPQARMLDAVRNGRPKSAMVRFDSTLTDEEIQAVVRYIRDELLGNTAVDEKYHSPENGWENHDRYSEAFPFVDGSLSPDAGADKLDANQVRGRNLYLSACISCHDQPNTTSGRAVWETRSVSYPRRHYSHREPPLDAVSGASPYARHDIQVKPDNMTDQQVKGMRLYLENCAFCHAPDGTGKNWIGSFLDPKPRDFTAPEFALHNSSAAFREAVRNGIPDSAMPAWRHVLRDEEIDMIVAYIGVAFGKK